VVNGALLVEVEKALEFVNENLKMQLGQAFLSAVQAPQLSTPLELPGTHLEQFTGGQVQDLFGLRK
jgi:hypothetical protein